MKRLIKCCSCDVEIHKRDIIALNKKLFGKQTRKFYCLKCMALYYDVTEEELLDKIEAFKEEGCELFK